MIKPSVRKMMDQHLKIARETEVESTADYELAMVSGMLGYAIANEDIDAPEHAQEWRVIHLIREQRANARRAQWARR